MLAENLRFVKPDTTDAELLDAMAKASAMGIVTRTGQGLETTIAKAG